MENIKFDISNLFAKKEVLISKEEIVEIVYFAIQNGIVKVEVTQTNDVEADENFIELQATGVMKLGYMDAVENVLIKPFDYKEDELTLDEYCSCGTSIYEECECK